MTLFSSSVRLSAIAAGLAGSLALFGAGGARATDYVDSVYIPTSNIGCGYFVRQMLCYGAVAMPGGSRNAVTGDTFTVHVDFQDRLYVGGSATSSIFTVEVIDGSALLGGGAPGPYLSNGHLDMLGYLGPPSPFEDTTQIASNFGYVAGSGFCCSTPNSGFSLTGADADIEVLSDSIRPLVAIAAGFGVVLPATPEVLANFQGAHPDAPVILPPGLIGQIKGNIGGQYGADQFYGFTWESDGPFQTLAQITGANSTDQFSFKLFDSSDTLLANILLDQNNGFSKLMSFGKLDAGLYKIGLTAWNPLDPAFTLTFITPVGSAIPEPSVWAMLIAGFGIAGAALRRRTRARRLA